MYILNKKLDAGQLLDLQNKQYFNALYLEGEVPNTDTDGGQQAFTLNVSNLGHFLWLDVTGSYSRKVLDDQDVVDDGTNHLRVQVRDGSNGLELFDDYIPLDLFLSPGGTRTMGVLVDAATGVPNASSQLFYPKRVEYLFMSNSEIIFNFKNDSDYANKFKIALWGVRIKDSASTTGL